MVGSNWRLIRNSKSAGNNNTFSGVNEATALGESLNQERDLFERGVRGEGNSGPGDAGIGDEFLVLILVGSRRRSATWHDESLAQTECLKAKMTS